MKKTVGKIFTLAMAALMLLCSIPASADYGVAPANIAITTTSVALDYEGLGVLYCYGETQVRPGYTAKTKVELQRHVDGGWETIKTWTKTATGTMAVIERNYAVESGYEYLVIATHYAYEDGTLIESYSLESDIVDLT